MDKLAEAVEAYLEFIRVPHPDLSYETRQELRNEHIRAMIVALAERKKCAA